MRQKPVSVSFAMFIFLLFSGIALAGSSPEVMVASHDWTYNALEDLCHDREIPGLSVSADLNRRQVALLVSRLLQHLSGEDHLESRRFGLSKNVYLDNMIFGYNQRVTPERALTATQVELLYRLVLEFREELEILGYSIQDFNLLYAESLSKEANGLLARQPLLYSEQALAAARKLGEERSASAATLSKEPKKEVPITEILATPIEPRSLWTGQFSSDVRHLPPASSLSVDPPIPIGPPLRIGSVEVSGGLRSVSGGDQFMDRSADIEGGAGYGLSVKVGDLALNTAVDVGVDSSSIPKVASTSVDLISNWADLFTVSAGYRQVKDDSDAEHASPLITTLGVSVPITQGRVHLGMTQEWGKAQEGKALSNDEFTPGVSLLKNIAEFGLSYDFKNDSSLRFNYSLIDFSRVAPETRAEAKFSIKF